MRFLKLNYDRMKILSVSCCLLLITLFSCDRTFKKSEYGLSVTGKVGEILVVCDQGVWDSEVKNYLDTNITQFIMPYFPDVATFELIHRNPQAFETGNKRWRNLMFIEIDPKAKENKVTKEQDTWANGQLVVRIVAKSMNELVDLCKSSLQNVHEEFDQTEWKRILTRFKNENNPYTSNQIKENFGIDIVLPKGSIIVSKRKNFFRVEFPLDTKPLEFVGGNGQAANFIQSGLLIYQYDYNDSSQFELSSLLRDRDTMLKYNVPHEVKGVYMGTQYAKIVYPEGSFMWNEKENTYGYEMRGMFKFMGNTDFATGGAFWSYHVLNKNKKLVCVSGYLDAPPTISWILPLREIQAILKSIEVTK